MELEPRLQKKLYEAYTKLFAQTTAKSVEIELISTVFKHFKEYEDLYKKACQKLKSFIENSDPNCKENKNLFVHESNSEDIGIAIFEEFIAE